MPVNDERFGRRAIVVQVSPRRWAVAVRTVADWEYELLGERYDSPNDAKVFAGRVNGEPEPPEK